MEPNDELKALIREAVREEMEAWAGPSRARLASRFTWGKVQIIPEDPNLKPHEFDIETLFHKVVMVRDALRVLEQRINSHEKLNDEDRVQLQQYITKVYGTLTTFNLLFRDEHDKFVGQRGKE